MFSGCLYKYSYFYTDEFISYNLLKFKIDDNDIDEEILKSILPLYQNKKVIFLHTCKYFGFSYKKGCYIYDRQTHNKHFFWEIAQIFKVSDEIFVRAISKAFEYIPKYHSFRNICTQKPTYSIISVSEIWTEPIEPYKINEEIFICPPYKLFE